MRAAEETPRKHPWGIIDAVVLNADDGLAESINNRIKTLNTGACGFRSEERLRAAIRLRPSGPDLYPDGVGA